MWRFAIGNNQAGQPSWWLYSANNEMVAWAGEAFASLSTAQRAAAAFKSGARSARYEVYADAAGQYRWRAWRSSDKVAASGEAFSTRAAAEQAAERVRNNAGTATL
jgi:uncharacterized protein YegP (UPF0339 family)